MGTGESFRYVSDTSAWEVWQQEYRYGALYIFPPSEVMERVDRLRSLHDPKSASICHAHVSLSRPLPRPLTTVGLQALMAALATFGAFQVRYGPLRDFPPYPGVALAIQPETTFRALRDLVHSTEVFTGTDADDYVAPHMTIAEFISAERTTDLMNDLEGEVGPGHFLCETVDYAVPNESFWFERRLSFPLG